jgi:hypothetical protein
VWHGPKQGPPTINKYSRIIEINACFSSINHVGIKELNRYNVNNILTNGKNPLEYKGEVLKYKNYSKSPSHLRNFTIKTIDDEYLSVITSANPSVSSRNESYVIINSKAIFDFINNSTHYYSEDSYVNNKGSNVINIGNEYHYINLGTKSPFDILRSIHESETVKDISFIQHGGGKKGLIEIDDILEKAENINFFISSLVVAMIKSTYEYIKSIQTKYGAVIKIETTHAKITLVKTDNDYYSIVSTANFNSKTKVEHTIVYTGENDYNYYLNFANKFFK